MKVLRVTSKPRSVPAPRLATEDRALRLGPGLLCSGQVIAIQAIVDGCPQLSVSSQLINTKIVEVETFERSIRSIQRVNTIVGSALILLGATVSASPLLGSRIAHAETIGVALGALGLLLFTTLLPFTIMAHRRLRVARGLRAELTEL